MATQRLLGVFALLFLQQMVLAVFTNPPPRDSEIDNPVYKLGQEIKITWNTDVEFTDLSLWQSGPNGKKFTLQSNSKSKSYTWISLALEHGKTSPEFASHRFNITDPSTETTSAPTGTKTNPPKSKTKTFDTATETTTENTAGGEPSTGLSAGATAGVAVGAIAGAALIAGAGFMLWRRRRTNKAAPTKMTEEDGQKHQYAAVEAPGDNTPRQGPWEMGGGPTHFTHELPADNEHRK
ncbi:hypothetical protein F53441_10457 [Fusarium austroafricanum]|uniref:Mid2 domain-containing protein n=1 Tax=Fusarium austroafricanum TaxID=2364996 RepID=A0A8H4K8N6_9HYPO|nr:hypothetical protein F53441_10457 [Fusarium austroafricanum]